MPGDSRIESDRRFLRRRLPAAAMARAAGASAKEAAHGTSNSAIPSIARTNAVPHPWRSYLRVSVRGLIVFVLVVGSGLGWIVRRAHIQRDAMAAINQAGGSVLYDWEWRDGKAIPGGKPRAPVWFIDVVGVDYFGQVTSATFFSSAAATDATLAQVGRLTRLQTLTVFSASVSDGGLAHLSASCD
jgi:hypothetical protein